MAPATAETAAADPWVRQEDFPAAPAAEKVEDSQAARHFGSVSRRRKNRFEGHKFSIENEVALERGESGRNTWETLAKHLLVAREERDLFS
jgi:hypothetical protein